MTTLDDFQSTFRAASGMPFHPESLSFANIALISDVNESVAQLLNDQVHQFLAAALPNSFEITTINSESYNSVANMLTAIEQLTPTTNLICTYRNLYNRNEDLPESLGTHVDVLTQRVDVPVLLLPRPDRVDLTRLSLQEVMAVTNHLSGDNHLISVAAHFTPEDGTHWFFLTSRTKQHLNATNKPSVAFQQYRQSRPHQLLRVSYCTWRSNSFHLVSMNWESNISRSKNTLISGNP